MSVIEQIEQAEGQAEQIRRLAQADAAELLRREQEAAHAQADRRIADAREKARQAVQAARQEAHQQAVSLLAQWKAENTGLAGEARVMLPAAVQSIVERVLG